MKVRTINCARQLPRVASGPVTMSLVRLLLSGSAALTSATCGRAIATLGSAMGREHHV